MQCKLMWKCLNSWKITSVSVAKIVNDREFKICIQELNNRVGSNVTSTSRYQNVPFSRIHIPRVFLQNNCFLVNSSPSVVKLCLIYGCVSLGYYFTNSWAITLSRSFKWLYRCYFITSTSFSVMGVSWRLLITIIDALDAIVIISLIIVLLWFPFLSIPQSRSTYFKMVYSIFISNFKMIHWSAFWELSMRT